MDLGDLHTLEERSFTYMFRNVKLPYVIAKGLESDWTTSAAPVN